MKSIKHFFLLLLLTMLLPGHSLAQQYIDGSDLYAMNGTKYQGKKYLYYNLLTYDGTQNLPPMPFQGDRIRDGKYKASATAMNNYIEEFKKNQGKIYTFVKFAPNPQMAGVAGTVFASETGDTLFVDHRGIKEFFSVEHLETEKKNIGKTLYEIDLTSALSSIKNNAYAIPAFFTYSDAKTKELKPSFLPFMSEWIIKDVNYDTNYYGDHSAINDITNTSSDSRLCYLIENKKYGSLICSFNKQKHTFSKDEAYSKCAKLRLTQLEYDEEDLQLLEKWATDGTADMKYFYFAVTEEKGKSKDEVREDLLRFAEQGSVAAAYKLVSSSDYYRNISYERLAEIVKKACKPVENISIYSDMYMKMGDNIYYRLWPLREKQDELDKAFAVGKEMYQLAEKCGADAQKLESAKEKFLKQYDACLKDVEETKRKIQDFIPHK